MVDDVEITIRGAAGATVRAAFEEFDFEVSRSGRWTRLRADLSDQAALHGVLERMRDLGVEIIEVRFPET